ncbi:flagellar basal body P-ring formation chaperone FlgA [Fulvimonas soli]|jgi:flagella basal body P-ring formation protein FlgA|uniref:Flagella basal body P-ring formation protein FlgA n=1 Tax=Fulvimonas soli TaxID=155197 RepID=A0A316HR63_9GAMM|nr:flagellar basal body P-ring formation chaperone FlgA [Fulvimonas soli]PWK83105.1 flagella basal body P-ring formation protein FlgA [Fulvimonas soli]TNY24981.1 flagella basal body P-ring formation protein FlgA [Fulvimonas soli]
MAGPRPAAALALLLAAAPAAAGSAGAARAFAANWLRHYYAQPGSRVEADAAPLDPRLQLADCPAPLAAGLPPAARPAPRMSVLVRCPVPGGWSVRVPVQLRLYRQVLVASRPLRRGDGIAAGDVHAEERDVTRLGYGYVESMDQVAERTLARPLMAGSVLTPAALGGRQMVRAGDRVELLAELDGIAVRAEGIALGSGDSGARLRVRNGSSGRVVDAVVRAPGQTVALP